MSYAPRGPGRSQESRGESDDQGAGSVRAARERLAQAQQRMQAGGYEPDVTSPLASQYSSMRSPRNNQPLPEPRIPGFGEGADSPIRQQWPLGIQDRPQPSQPLSSSRYEGSYRSNQSKPPASTLETFLETPRESYQVHPGSRDPWHDEDYLSPTYGAPTGPMTTSSRASDTSLGSIPDFPVPTAQRRSHGIGLPPTARRGPSSYYSNFSYVSPIKEESENRSSFKSYASSNVIPSNIPDFYLDETPSDEEGIRDNAFEERSKPVTLLRQASLGKRAKPNLTSIKNGKSTPSPPRDEPARLVPMPADPRQDQNPSRLGIDDAVLELSSPSSSAESLVERAGRLQNSEDSTRPLRSPGKSGKSAETASTNEMDQILGSLQKGGALPAGSFGPNMQNTRGGLSERVGARRPPRLNVDAVKEAEARGSLTSLPDLIRRATKLAANLDRGKTASRFGVDWMVKDNMGGDQEKKQHSSVNGMLRSFPAPGVGSGGNTTPRTEWPSNPGSQRPILGSEDYGSSKPEKRRQGYCGLSRRAFIALMIVLFFLVAAAVIIPVVLLVGPGKNGNSGDKVSQAKAICAKDSPCENSGSVTIMADGSCGCLCTNGFTGARCTNPSEVGCSTMSAAGVDKATVGAQIPRLMQASANFSIPLVDSVLLSQFARLNMTCSMENALVTFPGFTKRTDMNKRQDPSTAGILSNSLIIAGAPTPTATKPAAITMMPMPTITGAATPGTNTTARDFAKVGILFLLQDSLVMDVAVKAQEKLSAYITSATKEGSTVTVARNITLGNGYFINLYELTITLRNGTVYGNGWNGTATALTLTPQT